jgi:hypothetical protein
VLAGRAALGGGGALNVSLAVGDPNSAPALRTSALAARGLNATVGCGSFGEVAWSGADWNSPFLEWVAGPQMSSWIYRKPLPGDAHLVAWLELRLYAGGEIELLPWVENGYLLVPGAGARNATYRFVLNGEVRFEAAINLLNHQRTPLLSGSALSHWLGPAPTALAVHDTDYLQATRMVPTYRVRVAADSAAVRGLPAAFVPLQQGGFPAGMGAAGYHASIGLLPEWDVLYLASDAATVRAAVERNAYSAGRYGIHLRDETTNRPLRFSAHPRLVAGAGLGLSNRGASTSNTFTPTPAGDSPPAYTITHSPSMGYLAAIVSGRWYHLETLQFQAAANYLINGDGPRELASGVFQSSTGSNTTRGMGWAWRTLAQAAALSADDDPVGAELRSSLAANVDWCHARYVARPNNPQGWVQPYSDYTAPARFTTSAGSATSVTFPAGYVYTTNGYYVGWDLAIGGQVRRVTAYDGSTRTATVAEPFTVPTASVAAELRQDNVFFEATWMQDFVTAAMGMAKAFDVALPAGTAHRLNELFAWKARSVVGRLGRSVSDEYLFRDAAPFTIAVAPSNSADWVSGTGPWFANWGQLYDATFASASPGPRVDGGLRGGNFPDATSYWGNLQPALAYAVDHGVAGAAAAYGRMLSAPNWASFTDSLNTAAVWGVRPRCESGC